MKYSAIVMLFLGAISYTEARTDLVQIIEANGMTARSDLSDSDGESSDDETNLVQLNKKEKYGKYGADKGIIDATTPGKGQCTPRLWEAVPEMNW